MLGMYLSCPFGSTRYVLCTAVPVSCFLFHLFTVAQPRVPGITVCYSFIIYLKHSSLFYNSIAGYPGPLYAAGYFSLASTADNHGDHTPL